ncbi:amidase signature enzyme [Aaosphaeria arxii CBS 175.79]|uniref:Amidase signature enzyme n=1 Tax=Aaosphaeria arxii CBS 175.79 TaxID=1450172 RepID=A0A6A5XZ71_9PLEO|nr:amidase signature enzyme [Aaosphaeria arxii CBS 175.79]KAF2017594.1 amidase signature enzyme [Aaosphaeria arxii CBS 175.79]
MPKGSAAMTGFMSYPTPKAHNIPHQTHAAPQNPVVRGTLLHYLSSVVLSVPLLPWVLWNNAGFNSLRKTRELDNMESRFDPTVILLPRDGEVPINYNAVDIDQLRALRAGAQGRFYSIVDFHRAYSSGQTTPSDVVEALLPLIRRDIESRSPHSTAFVDTKVDLVRRSAEASTKRWKDGKQLGVLDGIPFALKDEMDAKGYKRFCGTTKDMTKGKEVETSWCARKLEEAGAVLIGKVNMHELGMDTTNNNPNWGTPLNPYNSKYYTGGSSGGSAYVVGSGIVPFAVGSDGGGSVRIPSNYCGVYGLKPSHGRVSIAPTISPANSTVVQGPLAANMVDLQIAYQVLAQPDPSHISSRQFAPPASGQVPRTKLIGIPREWFDRADPVVQEACLSAIQYFQSELGYEVIDVSIPLTHEGQLAHAMTILAECAAAEPDLSYLTAPNKILLKVAQQTSATDLLLAQKLRHLLMQHLADLYKRYPGIIIVTPTTPNPGWPIGDGDLQYGVSNGNMQVRNMEYVWLANFTGVPCIQFPVGYAEPVQGEGRIPMGLSGHGEWGSEDALIEFGFDGEAWLNKGYQGGRQMPKKWVDVLAKAAV